MTLCDTGPLVALIDRDDTHHESCKSALSTLPPAALVTTLPCMTEAMYLLFRAGGIPAQDELWQYLADGLVVIHDGNELERQRMRELMREYADTPMDFADASLVVLAEFLDSRTVFTVDRHFHAYRMHGNQSFTVVP